MEVLVEILLALLAQPSHLMRQVARTVFSHICSHLTPRALQLILDVLNPEQSPEEDSVVVTDDSEKQLESEGDKSSESEDDKHSASEEDSDEEDSDEEDRDGDVDQGFREQLMAVLQAGKALGTVDGEDDDDDELGDEAMMALDQSLASLFAEQKLRIQARRDEKNKLRKEKVLRRDFQIRALDLIEVLVTKQPENPLVLELLEPLLDIIRRSMRSSSSKQEQDLLHKTARIFTPPVPLPALLPRCGPLRGASVRPGGAAGGAGWPPGRYYHFSTTSMRPSTCCASSRVMPPTPPARPRKRRKPAPSPGPRRLLAAWI